MASDPEQRNHATKPGPRWVFAATLFLLSFGAAGVAADWLQARDGTYGYLKMFNEVLLLIQNSYVEETELPGLMRGAYDGLLGSLDPESEYLTREQYLELTRLPQEGDGEIGIDLSRRGGYLYVVSVVPGSPAARAGVRSGVRLRRIDGTSTREMTLTEGTLALRGPVDSKVEIEVFPAIGEGDGTVSLVREKVAPATPSTETHEGALVVRIPSLRDGAAAAVRKALEGAGRGGTPLLLDLRGSSTGTYDEATRVLSLFLGDASVGRIEGREGEQRELRTDGKPIGRAGGLGILVDSGTAGPAELVAVALKAAGGASLLGGRTFGRATLQEFLPLNDGGYLRLSIARCVGPDGASWDRSGLDPDHLLQTADDEALDRAIEILRNPASTG